MNNLTYFEIQATNVEKLVDFYSKVFDWEFVEVTGLPIKYFRIENAGINAGLLQRPAKTPPAEFGTNAFTCSIQVPDFDATSDIILENGGIVAMAKFEVPNRCWQGYFVDPDGNTFGLVQIF